METCDDGNLVDTDACKLDCSLAVCGDGVVWDENETCEDLNMVDTDECTNTCQQASCGDGILWDGMETCDDGNLSNNDMCPGSCAPAVCGDWYTLANAEECDDANEVDDDFCLNDCSSNGYYDNFESDTLQALPWSTGGNKIWSPDDTQPHEGSYDAASGNIDDDELSNLEVTLDIPTPGAVMFWYRVSSEEGWDYLTFFIDGVFQEEWSGDVPWAQASYPVDVGSHTLRWVYSKDSSLDDFQDTAWIDEVYVGIAP
jgi:cysteine-rich repeat protein